MSRSSSAAGSNPTLDATVAIVGAGPVGLMMAILLARLDIKSVVVERRLPRRSSAPKAHVINPRSLEICRAAGVDVEKMYAQGASRDTAHHVRFLETLVGREFGVLSVDMPESESHLITPTPLLNLAQPAFEAILEQEASCLPEVEIRRGHAWSACRIEDGIVDSSIQTNGSSYRLRTTYLIAADGANSAVRDHLGLEMDGDPAVRARVTIHFEADLRKLLRDRPGILYWTMAADAVGTFIAYDPARTWSFSPRAIPATFVRSDYSDDHCRTLIKRAIGVDDVRLEIKHVVPWLMAAQVARTYRKGNCFLIGDAAHRFPPTGGLGLNTGLQDAHNLAWKIAMVERGLAGGSLLETYEQERQPIARINTQQSLNNAARLPNLFGRAQAALAAREVTVQAAQDIRNEIETHREHFLSTGLQLGFSYGPPVRGPADPTRYDPSVGRGGRMPHAWLRHEGRRLSTLDLIDPGQFVLLAGPGGKSWPAFSRGRGLRLQVIDTSFEFETAWPAEAVIRGAGALLVRPDGHVAAVVPDDGGGSQQRVTRALERFLPHAPRS